MQDTNDNADRAELGSSPTAAPFRPKRVPYVGARPSLKGLEHTLADERTLQKRQVGELTVFESENTLLQESLVSELDKLRELATVLRRKQSRTGVVGAIQEFFDGVRGRSITRQSIEDLLRRQYELSAQRVREAADLADRLKMAEVELRDELARMNQKIIEAAKNEELAMSHVMDLEVAAQQFEIELRIAPDGTVEARQLRANLDKCQRELSEHRGLLKLYGTAEERIERLQDNTRSLADTIGSLGSDLTLYVTAASEKLDLIGGQVQAIGAAADASVVMLEMKRSLDSLTESIHHATQFVSETQAYFREHVDGLVTDLDTYDAETQALIESNLAAGESFGSLGVAEVLGDAMLEAEFRELEREQAEKQAAAMQSASTHRATAKAQVAVEVVEVYVEDVGRDS